MTALRATFERLVPTPRRAPSLPKPRWPWCRHVVVRCVTSTSGRPASENVCFAAGTGSRHRRGFLWQNITPTSNNQSKNPPMPMREPLQRRAMPPTFCAHAAHAETGCGARWHRSSIPCQSMVWPRGLVRNDILRAIDAMLGPAQYDFWGRVAANPRARVERAGGGPRVRCGPRLSTRSFHLPGDLHLNFHRGRLQRASGAGWKSGKTASRRLKTTFLEFFFLERTRRRAFPPRSFFPVKTTRKTRGPPCGRRTSLESLRRPVDGSL